MTKEDLRDLNNKAELWWPPAPKLVVRWRKSATISACCQKGFLVGILKVSRGDTIESVQALLIALGRSTWLTAFVKRSAHFVQFGFPSTFTHPKRRPYRQAEFFITIIFSSSGEHLSLWGFKLEWHSFCVWNRDSTFVSESVTTFLCHTERNPLGKNLDRYTEGAIRASWYALWRKQHEFPVVMPTFGTRKSPWKI